MSHFKHLLGHKLLSNTTAEDDFDIREYPDEEEVSSSCSTPIQADGPIRFCLPLTQTSLDAHILSDKHSCDGDDDEHSGMEDNLSYNSMPLEEENEENEVGEKLELELPGAGEGEQRLVDDLHSIHTPTSCSGYGDHFGMSEDCWRGDHGNTSLVDTDKVLQNKFVGVYVSDFRKPDEQFLAMLRQKYTFLRSKGVEVVFAWKHPKHVEPTEEEKERATHANERARDKSTVTVCSNDPSSGDSTKEAGWVVCEETALNLSSEKSEELLPTTTRGKEEEARSRCFFIDDEIMDDRLSNRRTWDAVTARMPWYCVPFENSRQSEVLCKEFKVTILPVFMIFDDQGELITLDGRGKLMTDVEHAPWLPPGEFHPGLAAGLATRATLALGTVSSSSSTDGRIGSKFPSPRNYAFGMGVARTRSQGELSDGESTTCSSMSRPRSPACNVSSAVPASARFRGPCDKNVMEGVPILSRSRQSSCTTGEFSPLEPRLERFGAAGDAKTLSRSRSWSHHGAFLTSGGARTSNSPTTFRRTQFNKQYSRSMTDRPLLFTADVGGSFVGGGLGGTSSIHGGHHLGGGGGTTHNGFESLSREPFPGNLSGLTRDPAGPHRRPSSLTRPAPVSAPSVLHSLPINEGHGTWYSTTSSSLWEEGIDPGKLDPAQEYGDRSPFEGPFEGLNISPHPKRWFMLNTSMHPAVHVGAPHHSPATQGTTSKMTSSGDLM